MQTRLLRYLTSEGDYFIYKEKPLSLRILFGFKELSKILKMTCLLVEKYPEIDSNKKIIFYIKDSLHLVYLKSLLNIIAVQDYIIIYNQPVGQEKASIEPAVDIIRFSIPVSITFYSQLLWLIFKYIILSKPKYMIIVRKLFFEKLDLWLRKIEPIHISKFISFNDQPWEVSAFIHSIISFNNNIKTFVFQHGMIMSKEYYFPCKSNYFFAYSGYNKQDFERNNRFNSTYVEIGNINYFSKYIVTNKTTTVTRFKILLATTQKITDSIRIISSIDKNVLSNNTIYFKAHHAMRLKRIIYLLCFIRGIKIEYDSIIDSLIDSYDVLVTEISTAALEFLSLNKCIIIINKRYKIREIYDSDIFYKVKNKISSRSLYDAVGNINNPHYIQKRINIMEDYFGVSLDSKNILMKYLSN